MLQTKLLDFLMLVDGVASKFTVPSPLLVRVPLIALVLSVVVQPASLPLLTVTVTVLALGRSAKLFPALVPI